MIPRYQRVLFWTLSAAILLMALFMLRGCTQVKEKFTRHTDQTPLDAPVATPTETVHLALADDSTGIITMADRDVALPEEQTSRARALLGRLLAEYSYKGSKHLLDSGPAVDDVFLLDLPLRPAVAGGTTRDAAPPESYTIVGTPRSTGGQLAVINLHGSFADHHPSGIEVESLTLQSIQGTLYANFPRIEQVRFLVDGQPRDTLSGHADLRRTYPVLDMSVATAQAAKGTDR
jgi:hypothetical protein